MSLFRPRKPSKPGARLAIWEMLFNGKFPFISDSNGKWAWGATGYRYTPNFPTGASGIGRGGIKWQTPYKELDPSIAVSKDTLVYISPKNPLVTDGMKDKVTGTVLFATPGIWLAIPDVPAQTSDTPPKFNVPQDPPPGSNVSAPTGTPLKGDADASGVYWLLVQEYSYCPNSHW